MKLTQDQKDLLNGKYGNGAAIAMKIQKKMQKID